MKTNKSLITAIIVVTTVIASIYIFSPKASVESGRFGRPPVAVDISEVTTGSIAETRQLTGSVVPKSKYIVSPKIPGRVIRIYKRIGDPVKSGEIVAKLDDEELILSLREAQANLEVARATEIEANSGFELARLEYERTKSLLSKGFVAQSDLESAQNRLVAAESRHNVAKAQLDSRSAAVDMGRIRLKQAELYAASNGFVGERFVDEGALLNTNQPLLSIVSYDEVFIRTTIVEKDIAKVNIGMHAEIEVDAHPGKFFSAIVSNKSPMLDANSRMAEVELNLENSNLMLQPGMYARVNLTLQHKENVQLVSSRALVWIEGTSGIYQVDKEKLTVEFIPVNIGITNSDYTEILSPILLGPVVTIGQHLLSDGGKVSLPSQSDGGEATSGQMRRGGGN